MATTVPDVVDADEGDDLIEDAKDLPMDVRDGDVGADEPPDGVAGDDDTDVDLPVLGSPDDDVIHDEDDD